MFGVAKLIGDSDAHTVVRRFDDAARAKAWLQGEGLADFDDQTASGELHSDGGDIIWRKSHLQAPDRAERDNRVFWNRLFARVGLGVGKKDWYAPSRAQSRSQPFFALISSALTSIRRQSKKQPTSSII